MLDAAATPSLTLPAALLGAAEKVHESLAERTRIDRALAQKRSEIPNVAELDTEADRLASAAEADQALAAADASLGDAVKTDAAPAKAARAARQKHAEAVEQSRTLERTIAELENRVRRADDAIIAAGRDLQSAATLFAAGEAKTAWRADYHAAVEELVRQLARAQWLGRMLAGDWRLYHVQGVLIPDPDGPTPLVDNQVGSMLPSLRGAIGALADDARVCGDWPELCAPVIEARRQLAAHRPYEPPKPPAAPYERKGYDGPWVPQSDPASRAAGQAMRWGHLSRR